MTYEPVLTASMSPSPRVQIDFNTVDPSAVRARVERTADGVTGVVRDGRSAFAAGGFTLRDFEIPTGVTASYRAEMFDAAGVSLGFTGSTSAELFDSSTWAWFSDPFVPDHVVSVKATDKFAAALSRSRAVSRHNVGGQQVALYGSDGLLEGVNLSVYTSTDESAAQLREVLSAGFVLVRTMPPMALPRLFYAFIGKRNEVGLDIHMGGQLTRWDLVGDELSPNDVGVAIPSVSWQTYIDAFPTWQDMIDAYPTWLDAMKNPPVV